MHQRPEYSALAMPQDSTLSESCTLAFRPLDRAQKFYLPNLMSLLSILISILNATTRMCILRLQTNIYPVVYIGKLKFQFSHW